MDIFEFAIQMECEGQEYYHELASQTNHTGIKNILMMLADDEIKHQQAIEKIRITTCIMPETQVLDNAKNVFRQIKDFGGQVDLSGDEEKLYRHAMDLELKSRSFYQDRADQVKTPEQKALFRKLADEENRHYQIMRNLVDFVQAPKTWLADAEFERLDEY
jgi:rubrerythrin